MKNKKDNQGETIIIEIIAWVFFFGLFYIFSKGALLALKVPEGNAAYLRKNAEI